MTEQQTGKPDSIIAVRNVRFTKQFHDNPLRPHIPDFTLRGELSITHEVQVSGRALLDSNGGVEQEAKEFIVRQIWMQLFGALEVNVRELRAAVNNSGVNPHQLYSIDAQFADIQAMIAPPQS